MGNVAACSEMQMGCRDAVARGCEKTSARAPPIAIYARSGHHTSRGRTCDGKLMNTAMVAPGEKSDRSTGSDGTESTRASPAPSRDSSPPSSAVAPGKRRGLPEGGAVVTAGFARSLATGRLTGQEVAMLIDGEVSTCLVHCDRNGTMLTIKRGSEINDIPAACIDRIEVGTSEAWRLCVTLQLDDGRGPTFCFRDAGEGEEFAFYLSMMVDSHKMRMKRV